LAVDEPLRLRVDFNYSGRDGEKGVVFLYPKSGDRSGLKSSIQVQFDEAGVELSDGLPVILYEPAADADDDGTVCDMEVVGTLQWDQVLCRWHARYEWNAMKWIASGPAQD
jgi:hypothetical protein